MDVLNEGSLEVVDARLEPSLAELGEAEPVQFERLGYFVRDADGRITGLDKNRTGSFLINPGLDIYGEVIAGPFRCRKDKPN